MHQLKACARSMRELRRAPYRNTRRPGEVGGCENYLHIIRHV
jgi:hypothetical protein